MHVRCFKIPSPQQPLGKDFFMIFLMMIVITVPHPFRPSSRLSQALAASDRRHHYTLHRLNVVDVQVQRPGTGYARNMQDLHVPWYTADHSYFCRFSIHSAASHPEKASRRPINKNNNKIKSPESIVQSSAPLRASLWPQHQNDGPKMMAYSSLNPTLPRLARPLREA